MLFDLGHTLFAVLPLSSLSYALPFHTLTLALIFFVPLLDVLLLFVLGYWGDGDAGSDLCHACGPSNLDDGFCTNECRPICPGNDVFAGNSGDPPLFGDAGMCTLITEESVCENCLS